MSYQADYSRREQTKTADIGEIPPTGNPERREAGRNDLHYFLRTYFPHSTGRSPFGDDHIRAISRIESCILTGGLFSNAFPRGLGKTTISENSSLWAVLYGHRKFVAIFGASSDSSSGMIDSIKLELSENDLLYEDFPEVCHAVRALEGKPQRCASQHMGGALTHIEWTADKIAMATIAGSDASGAVITTRGITGATRGMKHKVPGGKQQRPDFVIIDDPQTDESASTELQVNKRLDVIRKSILKLGGHDYKMAVVMNATVIRRGDLVDQIGDPKKFPAWQSERIKMVSNWSLVHDSLWLGTDPEKVKAHPASGGDDSRNYASIRNTYDPLLLGDQARAHRDATEFYLANREAMDANCKVAWDYCFDPTAERSAVQHAYNLLIDDGPEVFASECQNEPLVDAEHDDGLTADEILAKERFNNLKLGTVPINSTRLVAHIDVMGTVLFWMVVAYDESYGATIVDFGTWPDVPRGYFARRDLRKSLRSATKADSDGAAVYQAVQACIDFLASRSYPREGGGAAATLDRCGVDAKWGEFVDEVFQACRESSHASIVVPTMGQFYGVTSRNRLEDTKPAPGDRQGIGWRYVRSATKTKRGMAYLLIDTNRWKTFADKSIRTSAGGAGSLRINGRYTPQPTDRLRLLADHLTSERCWMKEVKGRVAPEWEIKQKGRDNDWWDNLVCCYVLAALLGVREPTAAAPKARQWVKLSEIQKQKRAG